MATGRIRKREDRGTWQAIVSFYDEAGERRERTRTFPIRRDAQAWLNEHLAGAEGGDVLAAATLTVEDYLSEWLGGLRLEVAESTWSWYESAVRVHIVPVLGRVRLRDLRASHVKRMLSDKAGDLSPKSLRWLYTTMNKALGDGVRSGVLSRNPLDAVKAPRVPKAEGTDRAWSPEELRSFLAYVAEDRLYALWRLAASTGLRRGELLGLCWDDLDLEESRAHIRRQLAMTPSGGIELRDTKTASGRRTVSLDARTVAALRTWRVTQAEERLAFGEGWGDTDGLLWTWPDGRRIRPDWLSRRFVDLVEEAGLPRRTLHDLRHTHATLALRAGEHPKVVQHRLGHASSQITMDTYSSVAPDLAAEAAERVAQIVDGQ